MLPDAWDDNKDPLLPYAVALLICSVAWLLYTQFQAAQPLRDIILEDRIR